MTAIHAIHLSKYGAILTGREKGKGVMELIEAELATHAGVVEIDLAGVISMGSSFGDEVFPKIAQRQHGKIRVKNAGPSVRHCLGLVAEDSGIQIEFVT